MQIIVRSQTIGGNTVCLFYYCNYCQVMTVSLSLTGVIKSTPSDVAIVLITEKYHKSAVVYCTSADMSAGMNAIPCGVAM